ncbi:hypothetical protein [Alcaligenes faecalis]|uniref:hypothetical protein n=1 Tax=Alcaligenes faecalis TaxID=511 RepID=UPI001EF0D177|nr:hypothetical protein [Alcaligenes faecalis]ULH08205.1 hypothetical protein MF263_07070 [Alcaligenes faecalis]
MAFLTIIGFLLFMAFGFAQIWVGFIGFEDWLGSGWAWGITTVCVLTRILFPLTVASFFGAMNVLGWHWALALLFAAPGLIFIVPGIIGMLFETLRMRRA